MIVGLLVSSTVSGQIISRTGRYKKFMIAGAVLLTAGLGAHGHHPLRHDASRWSALYLVVIGAGVGMLMQNLVLAVQNTLDVREIGSGTSTVAFFRTLGGALGVSALGVVLVPPGHRPDGPRPGRRSASTRPRWAPTARCPDLSTLPENVRIVVEQSFGNAIADLFLVAAPVALISLIAVLFLKEVPLGTRSGIEQLLEQEGEALAPASADVPTDVDAELDALDAEQKVTPRS